jgi:hypothetical protein
MGPTYFGFRLRARGEIADFGLLNFNRTSRLYPLYNLKIQNPKSQIQNRQWVGQDSNLRSLLDNWFTVSSLCRSGHRPLAPLVGLEPTTPWFEVRRSLPIELQRHHTGGGIWTPMIRILSAARMPFRHAGPINFGFAISDFGLEEAD